MKDNARTRYRMIADSLNYVYDEALIRKSKEYPYGCIRAMIWRKMRAEGYTLHEIADASDRSHTTVLQGARKAQDYIDSHFVGCARLEEINKIIDSL